MSRSLHLIGGPRKDLCSVYRCRELQTYVRIEAIWELTFLSCAVLKSPRGTAKKKTPRKIAEDKTAQVNGAMPAHSHTKTSINLSRDVTCVRVESSREAPILVYLRLKLL